MTESVTDLQARILRVLAEEQKNLARDLSARDIHEKAFPQHNRVSRTKMQLEHLEWRGLVFNGIDGWRITDAGTEVAHG